METERFKQSLVNWEKTRMAAGSWPQEIIMSSNFAQSWVSYQGGDEEESLCGRADYEKGLPMSTR